MTNKKEKEVQEKMHLPCSYGCHLVSLQFDFCIVPAKLNFAQYQTTHICPFSNQWLLVYKPNLTWTSYQISRKAEVVKFQILSLLQSWGNVRLCFCKMEPIFLLARVARKKGTRVVNDYWPFGSICLIHDNHWVIFPLPPPNQPKFPNQIPKRFTGNHHFAFTNSFVSSESWMMG